MTPQERQLMVETAKELRRLYRERNDLVLGVTAALLDVYRGRFQSGHDTKGEAVQRLTMQLKAFGRRRDRLGTIFLGLLIQTLRNDQLNAAKLLRETPMGRS
jgi:hypothetical protein